MPVSTRVTQTVILAAGSGSRLAATRGDVPKPLMTVAGAPLIAHALEHAASSGCTEAVIVVGYEGERVRAAIEAMHTPLHVRFLHNPDYASPNGVSLLAAAPAAAPLFFLQMVDHLFEVPVLARLAEQPLGASAGGRVLIDSRPSADLDLDDATKVCLADGGTVSAIGKGLAEWDAIDAGCFVLSHAIFDALRSPAAGTAPTVSAGMRHLVSLGLLGSYDLAGARWIDVDTPADREIAERLLAGGRLASERR